MGAFHSVFGSGGSGGGGLGFAITVGALLSLVRGDDYRALDGRQFNFEFAGCPNLSGATAALHISTASFAGVVTGPTTLRFELTAAQTLKLTGGYYTVHATLSDGDVITLSRGVCQVSAA